MQVELSLCGKVWDNTEITQREEVFNKHRAFPTEFIGNNGVEVGQGNYIYRVNGQYYKETEAWKLILGINMCSTEIEVKAEKVAEGTRIPEEKKSTSLNNLDKLVSSLRPSEGDLKSFELREGENDLVYEYYVNDSVLDRVQVKIYLYNSNDKIVISDIDGTITK